MRAQVWTKVERTSAKLRFIKGDKHRTGYLSQFASQRM